MHAYDRLRPPEPTPGDEICACADDPPVKVMWTLSFNPIHCMNCNLEVPPERLAMTEELAQAAAHWNWVAGAVRTLELDSGAYEEWAQRELEDIDSPINVEGRQLAEAVAEIRPCYFLYFTRHDDPRAPIEECPSCGLPLEPYRSDDRLDQRICHGCMIVAFAYLRPDSSGT